MHRGCVDMEAKGRRSVSVLTRFGEAAALCSRMALPSELPLMELLGPLLASPSYGLAQLGQPSSRTGLARALCKSSLQELGSASAGARGVARGGLELSCSRLGGGGDRDAARLACRVGVLEQGSCSLASPLSSSSKNFGSQTTKGGGGRMPPPPFVVFSATQNCSDWCLNHKEKHFQIIRQLFKILNTTCPIH